MSAPTHKIAIIGASGYTGEELVKLLLRHPAAEIVAVTSRQHAGQRLAESIPALRGRTDLQFTAPDVKELLKLKPEVVFLALPHGVAAEYVVPLMEAGATVIDLSADFRLRSAEVYKEFYSHEHPAPQLLEKAVYGLPELHRKQIARAKLIGSPGCYPTSVLLGAWPAFKHGLVKKEGIVADSLSGVSGAGKKPEVDYLFSECAGSAKAYGVPKHRHLSEIEQELSAMAGSKIHITFTPHLIPVNRGILTTLYFELAKEITQDAAQAAYEETYAKEPFVRVSSSLPEIKNVAGTNFCDIGVRVDPRTRRLVVVSAEDNLIKGAGGQAIQSMNLILGLPEATGLL
ncbi:MAG: N-acetyl-gamma-glutamyl-phosphate reductase [Verrucomicrobiae bacterium]|nr:N-acetyl-gamma-glutamyl-phosphate reductase [Verrucomicrobiae bacterium]